MWAVKGLGKLMKGGKSFPEHSRGRQIKEQHQRDCDPERVFLEECYAEDTKSSESSVEVYDHYREWMRGNGFYPMSHANFARAVERVHGVRSKRDRRQGGRSAYAGIKRISAQWPIASVPGTPTVSDGSGPLRHPSAEEAWQ